MQQTIVGISLGTRIIGIAVYRIGLVDWQIKSFRDRQNAQRMYAISGSLLRLCSEYDCHVVTIKLPHRLESHKSVLDLYRHLERKMKAHGITVTTYTLEDIKKVMPDGGSKSKLSRWVAVNYPELHDVYRRDRANDNTYHTKLFEAVAAVHCYIHT